MRCSTTSFRIRYYTLKRGEVQIRLLSPQPIISCLDLHEGCCGSFLLFPLRMIQMYIVLMFEKRK